MNVDCKHVWNALSEYIDGDIDPTVRKEIELHLEFCEICSAVLDSTRNILILTADERVFELPGGFSTRLHARIDEELKGENGDKSTTA